MPLSKTILLTAGTTLLLCIGHTSVFATPKPKPVWGKELGSAWQYKRAITIENQGDKVLNAVIPIVFTKSAFDYAQAKANGADVRFTTASGRLTGDGLAYWIEEWNDQGKSRIWVKVPTLNARGTTTIQIYYGNSKAQVVSNGDKTFLFFDDFEDGDYTKKWTNTSVGEVLEQDGLLKLKETDGQDGIITANIEIRGPLVVRTLYQRGKGDGHWVRAGVGGWDKWLCLGDYTDNAAFGTNYVMLFDSMSLSNLTSAPLVKAANTVITDKWRRVAYWYDGRSLKGQQDDVVVELPIRNASSRLTLRTLDNDDWDCFAYVTVSAYTGPDPTVTVGQQQSN